MTRVLVLDIGGVLVKLGGMRQFVAWTGQDPAEIQSRWLASRAVRDFESGRLSFQLFASTVIREFGLPIGPEELRVEMHTWTGELFDGAQELLAETTERHRVVCLCNSNHIQWPRVRDELGLGRWFSEQFVSHEIGLAKPQPEIYVHVERELGVSSEDIAFFDDSLPNVDGAAMAGWSAHQVNGTGELRTELARLGFL
jgi:putative hydrolase of the HAD superfamily